MVTHDTGNPQALTRYSYVLGNPLKYVDPSGHDPSGFDAGGAGNECNADPSREE